MYRSGYQSLTVIASQLIIYLHMEGAIDFGTNSTCEPKLLLDGRIHPFRIACRPHMFYSIAQNAKQTPEKSRHTKARLASTGTFQIQAWLNTYRATERAKLHLIPTRSFNFRSQKVPLLNLGILDLYNTCREPPQLFVRRLIFAGPATSSRAQHARTPGSGTYRTLAKVATTFFKNCPIAQKDSERRPLSASYVTTDLRDHLRSSVAR